MVRFGYWTLLVQPRLTPRRVPEDKPAKHLSHQLLSYSASSLRRIPWLQQIRDARKYPFEMRKLLPDMDAIRVNSQFAYRILVRSAALLDNGDRPPNGGS